MSLATLLKSLIDLNLMSVKDAVLFLIHITKEYQDSNPNLPLTSSNSLLAPSQDLLKQLQLSCNLCNRCSTRKQVVVPEIGRDQKYFIISYYPDVLSDKTGIPLSSSMELKSSLCVKCNNFNTCYNSKFTISQEFSISNEKEKVLQRIKLINPEDLKFPGKVLSNLLISGKKDPTLFKGVRESWQTFFDIVATDEKVRKSWDIPSKFYITYLVKCYSQQAPSKEEVDICKNWLIMERQTSPAEFTIILGKDVFFNLFEKSFEEALLTPFEDEIFKTVITTYSLEEIISCNDLEKYHRMCKHLLDSLLYVSKINKEELDLEDIV